MDYYKIFLSIHALLRWVVLLAALYVLFRAYSGWLGKKGIEPGDNFAGLLFTSSVHLQFLLGLVLYLFISPFTKVAFQDFGAAMKDPVLRYWAVEHISINLLAVIMITIGRASSKRGEDTARHRKAAIFYTIGLLLILVAVLTIKDRAAFRFLP